MEKCKVKSTVQHNLQNLKIKLVYLSLSLQLTSIAFVREIINPAICVCATERQDLQEQGCKGYEAQAQPDNILAQFYSYGNWKVPGVPIRKAPICGTLEMWTSEGFLLQKIE